MTSVEPIVITVDEATPVSGLLQQPPGAHACFVLAHGAGAGMAHPFMATVAAGLAARGIATLRYQFPAMERGSKRPDSPKVAHATVRAATAAALRLVPDLPLFAGGKSFGGRMTSQAQALLPLPVVRGLIFLGFPLHPAGRPSRTRADHLGEVHIPMLFLQGTRDTLAAVEELQPVCENLGASTVLKLFDQADHSFHVPARSGRRDSAVLDEAMDTMTAWIGEVMGDRV